MRKIIIYCLITIISIGYVNAQDSTEDISHTIQWEHDFKKAQKLSKSTKKPLLIFFTGSDWCGPCKKLVSDFFESEEFSTIADKDLILYEADFPRNKDLVSDSQKKDNQQLEKKYNTSQSYPLIVVIDEKGKELGRKSGYNFLMRDTSYHFQFLQEVLE